MTEQEIARAEEPRPLAELETIIERGFQTFVEVGAALLEIRERWGFNRQRASQIIQAAEVSNMLDSPPKNTRQAVELGRLRGDLAAVREVWAEVQDEHGADVTAADVRAGVDRRLGVLSPTERQPVIGDVMDEIREQFDEEALAAEQALGRHIDTMARVRVTWLRFVSENPPGVFLDGLDRAGIAELVRDLDRFITWLQQARDSAAEAGRPRRVHL